MTLYQHRFLFIKFKSIRVCNSCSAVECDSFELVFLEFLFSQSSQGSAIGISSISISHAPNGRIQAGQSPIFSSDLAPMPAMVSITMLALLPDISSPPITLAKLQPKSHGRPRAANPLCRDMLSRARS